MVMDIWSECKSQYSFTELQGDIYRLVESQEQIATNQLVDNLEEQALLEQMLENSKPQVDAARSELHYLLYTPFRYPPLPHGSRFATRFEPSLFYGSKQIRTALTEAAYYRFVFWHGMSEAPPSKKLKTQHTIFAAKYASHRGVQLQFPPFNRFVSLLADPQDYSHSQSLGRELRKAGTEMFEFRCARCADEKINIALFTPKVFIENTPHEQQTWLCETTAENVTFFGTQNTEVVSLSLNTFLVDGKLPQPAI